MENALGMTGLETTVNQTNKENGDLHPYGKFGGGSWKVYIFPLVL